jgi:predicted transcriptional regulator
MTQAMTVRLDEKTARELAQLADGYPSRSAAVVDAIHQAWRRQQDELLDAAYAAAVAQNPNYPYESSAERAALTDRRNRRETAE